MEKYSRKFKTSDSLWSFLETVLEKEKIDYQMIVEKEQRYILTNISGMQFSRFVEEAMCIKQQKGRRVPVLPYRILKNDTLRSKALKKANCNGYTVLRRDLEKVKRYVWQLD